MKFRKGDKVKIISGKDRGKEGAIEKVFVESGLVVVHGINVAKKHVKPGKVSKEGGIISVEKPLNSANVALVCAKCAKTTRVGYKLVDGKKYRVCKRCKNTL